VRVVGRMSAGMAGEVEAVAERWAAGGSSNNGSAAAAAT
jgi:hypothetical protein